MLNLSSNWILWWNFYQLFFGIFLIFRCYQLFFSLIFWWFFTMFWWADQFHRPLRFGQSNLWRAHTLDQFAFIFKRGFHFSFPIPLTRISSFSEPPPSICLLHSIFSSHLLLFHLSHLYSHHCDPLLHIFPSISKSPQISNPNHPQTHSFPQFSSFPSLLINHLRSSFINYAKGGLQA